MLSFFFVFITRWLLVGGVMEGGDSSMVGEISYLWHTHPGSTGGDETS